MSGVGILFYVLVRKEGGRYRATATLLCGFWTVFSPSLQCCWAVSAVLCCPVAAAGFWCFGVEAVVCLAASSISQPHFSMSFIVVGVFLILGVMVFRLYAAFFMYSLSLPQVFCASCIRFVENNISLFKKKKILSVKKCCSIDLPKTNKFFFWRNLEPTDGSSRWIPTQINLD